jgi:hypothetical protein
VIVLDIAALLFGIASLVVAITAVRLARSGKKHADRALSGSLDAVSRSAAAAELANRAHAEATDAVNRSVAADGAAERARSDATEALSRAKAAASLAREVDEANRVAGGPAAHSEVRWEAEQVHSSRWLIRNVSNSIAAAALVSDASRPPKFITAAEVIPRDVGPGDNLQFRVASARDVDPPRLRVTWSEPGVPERRAFELTLVI